MRPWFIQRKDPSPSIAALTTQDSAIHSDISRVSSKIYTIVAGNAGSVDAAATAVLTINAGGIGVHGFNSASQSGVRSRESFFVAQSGSSTHQFDLYLQSHSGDAVGKKVVMTFRDSTGTVVASTVVTLTAVLTKYSVAGAALTVGNEYRAGVNNDPALGADAGARCFVGTQRVFSNAVTGFFAPGYSRLHVESTIWFRNLENFAYVTGSYWSYTTGRGHEVSAFAWIEAVLNSGSIVFEMSGNAYAAIGPVGSGVTANINNGTFQDYKLTIDTVLKQQVIPLPGVANTNLKLTSVGRNGRAASFTGTLYRAVFWRTADSVQFKNAAYEEDSQNALVIGGDSISDGFEADPQVQNAWNSPNTLGVDLGRPIFIDSAGGRTLSEFTTQNFINEEISKVSQPFLTDLVEAYATNDFQNDGSSSCTLAEFQTDTGAIADRLHAVNASARSWHFNGWIKPGFEGVLNSANHTMDDFRDAVIMALALRGNPNWMRVVTTKNWLISLGGNGDDFNTGSIHPKNQGHAKMRAKAAAVLVASKVTLSPTSPSVRAGSSVTFTASGGVGPYSYLFIYGQNNSGAGSKLNSATGRYTAGLTPATDYIYAIDSLGQCGTAAITVTARTVVITGTASVAPSATINFSAAGGTGPYTWSMVSNPSGGTIVAGTGVYTAGTIGLYNEQTVDVVRALDSVGNTSDFDVTVIKTFNMPAGNTLWLNAAKGITVLNTRKTSGVLDQGPSGHNLTMSTDGHRPFIEPNGINGFPTLKFNRGYTSALSTGLNLSAFFTNIARTLIAVTRLHAVIGTSLSGNGCEQNDSMFGETSGYYQFEWVKDAGGLYKLMVNDYVGADQTLISTVDVPLNTPVMATTHKSGGTEYIQVNQTPEITKAVGATGSVGIPAYIGAGYSQVKGFSGELAEMFIFDNDIGGTAILYIQAYLKEKYNI